MSGVNKVILVGRVGKDPEIRFTADGKPIANLSLATSETWKDQQGQKQEKTEWHRVTIFGGTAQVVADYVKKGSQLYLEGKIQTRKWQDQQGQDRYSTEVVLSGFGSTMQMLGGGESKPNQQTQNQSQQGYQQQDNQQKQSRPAPPPNQPQGAFAQVATNIESGEFIDDKNIPF